MSNTGERTNPKRARRAVQRFHLRRAGKSSERETEKGDFAVNAPTYLVLAAAIVTFLVGASVSRIYATDGRLFIVASPWCSI